MRTLSTGLLLLLTCPVYAAPNPNPTAMLRVRAAISFTGGSTLSLDEELFVTATRWATATRADRDSEGFSAGLWLADFVTRRAPRNAFRALSEALETTDFPGESCTVDLRDFEDGQGFFELTWFRQPEPVSLRVGVGDPDLLHCEPDVVNLLNSIHRFSRAANVPNFAVFVE